MNCQFPETPTLFCGELPELPPQAQSPIRAINDKASPLFEENKRGTRENRLGKHHLQADCLSGFLTWFLILVKNPISDQAVSYEADAHLWDARSWRP